MPHRPVGRIEQREFWKEFPIETAIAREEPGRLSLSVRANQKIRQDTRPLTTLLSIHAPRAARDEVRCPGERLDPNVARRQKLVAFLLLREVNAEFRVHQVADDQGAGTGGPIQGFGGKIAESFVRQEDVEKDVGIDSSDHFGCQRPRTSSINLSTDVYPSSSKLALHRPFHLFRSSFRGAFFRTIEPFRTSNSTSVSGPRPNRVLISFGIVTWPRSPIFILSSMTHNPYQRNQYPARLSTTFFNGSPRRQRPNCSMKNTTASLSHVVV